MPPTFTQQQISLSGLTTAEVATLKTAQLTDRVVATFQQNGTSGNLQDLDTSQFNGSLTFRPVDPLNPVHRGEVLTLVDTVTTNPFTGWAPS
jgi:hypothetical protein